MEPSLSSGDLLFVSEVIPSDIKASDVNGDIVVIKGPQYFEEEGGCSLFWSTANNTPIIHRVIDKKYDNKTNLWYFATKGDNNDYIDGSIIETYSSENYCLYEYNISNPIYISEKAILGIVIFKIPYIGLLQEFSFILFIIFDLLFCVFIIFKILNIKFLLYKDRIKHKIYHSKLIGLMLAFISFFFFIQFLPLLDNVFFMMNESMEPIMHFNDLLIAEDIDALQMNIGDIVVIRSPQYFYSQGYDPMFWHYYPNSSYIVHRVLDKKLINNSWYFMTGGDQSSLYIDGMIKTLNKSDNYLLLEFNRSNIIYLPEEEILGRVIYNIPLIGYFVDYFITFFIFFSTIFITVIILRVKGVKLKFLKIERKK
jgi:signal peptidase I